ncbi:S8 family serine peptidase [Streptomyces sp. NPDC008150]|uniref:S8 family serine peptidase n=1 Tax=Streptomyces sp. NPDC008150 TaxID=3364816 RepID=UPI0036EC41E2
MSSALAPPAMAADAESQEWYLTLMKADDMWKVSDGSGIKVAVLDSGVNPNTSSLKGQVLADETPKSASFGATDDFDGHGTSMAEMIAGTGNGGGIKGLAPGAKIVPYQVNLGDSPDQKRTPTVVEALKAAADSDARIINMSFSGPYRFKDEQAAVNYAFAKGKLLFASTGNDAESKNSIGYPASYDRVVGVAAADESGTVGKFSEHGGSVDLAAPGLDVLHWCDAKFTKYCTTGGTSASTAIASASAALIWSAHPGWTANQVLRTLIDTAGRDWPKDEPSNYLGYGLIRPRLVLADSKIDPGAAGADPLALENGTAATPASATPSVPASSQPPAKGSSGATSAAGSSASDSGGNSQLWVVLGAVGVVVVGGGAFAALRARRAT